MKVSVKHVQEVHLQSALKVCGPGVCTEEAGAGSTCVCWLIISLTAEKERTTLQREKGSSDGRMEFLIFSERLMKVTGRSSGLETNGDESGYPQALQEAGQQGSNMLWGIVAGGSHRLGHKQGLLDLPEGYNL